MKHLRFILVALALTACDKEPIEPTNPAVEAGETVEVSLDWSVSGLVAGDDLTRMARVEPLTYDMTSEPLTRTVPADMESGGAYNDISPKILNMWILQFNGTALTSRMLGAPRFMSTDALLAGSTYPLSVNVQLVPTEGEAHTIFVANIPDGFNYNWNLTYASTLADAIKIVKTLTTETNAYVTIGDKKTLLMSAVTDNQIVAGGTLTANFKRNVAKVTLNLTLSNPNMTIHSVRMRNVSDHIIYVDDAMTHHNVLGATDIFPVDVTLFDYAPVTTGMPANGETKTFSWYVPRNQQGVVKVAGQDELFDYDKTMYAPRNATYFEIAASKTGTTPTSSIFRVYPGANLTNDFNIRANHEYTVNLNVTDIGIDQIDTRVETFRDVDYSIPLTNPGRTSNSFILNPAPVGGVARTYTIPIDQVNRYWDSTAEGYGNKNEANVIEEGHGWEISLVWRDLETLFSTNPSSTTAITLVDNNGTGVGKGTGPNQSFQLRVPAGLPAGNFVLGIKKNAVKDEYLWSWHFWVTDYNPDKFSTSSIAEGKYTYPVPGGQVERYADYDKNLWKSGYPYAKKVMMDRNLGAVEDFFTTQIPSGGKRGALFYQYGRKDPFTFSSYASTWKESKPTYTMASGPVAIAESVKYPDKFYVTESRSINWVAGGEAESYAYVWNDPQATSQGKKSIYDPCPPGWRLPVYDTWRDFGRESGTEHDYVNTANPARDLAFSWGRGIGSASSSVNGLRYWPGGGKTPPDPVSGRIWYPATGLLLNDGELDSYSNNGYYWLDTPRESSGKVNVGQNMTFYLDSSEARVKIYENDGQFRPYALAVRCVSSN